MEKIIFSLTHISFVKDTEMTDKNMSSTDLQVNNMEHLSDAIENNTMLEKRQVLPRTTKRNSGLGIKHHAIKKRNQEKLKDFTTIKPQNILKYYTNKSLKNFKPSCLETIIEEPTDNNGGEDNDGRVGSNFIMNRKLRRYINFSHIKSSKISKRRAKIKKIFGRRLPLKKITMEEFLEKFNNNENFNEEN